MELKAIIAKNIINLRTSNKMTQLMLAQSLNYSDKAVSKWERAESIPDIITLQEIAKLFNVTVDYLLEEEHEEKKEPISNSTVKVHTIVTTMSILLVWMIAILLFILLEVFSPKTEFHWLTYIYAIPTMMIVWLTFNSIWFYKKRNYVIISVLMWSVFLAFHLTCLAFDKNIWQSYLLGAPGQLIIILWSCISKGNKNHHSSI